MKLLLKQFVNWFLIIFLTLTSTNSYVFAQNIDQFALPTGGQVISGNIDINQPSVGRLDVNQTTQQGIVNWNTFNVGSSASVYFNQPTNKSTILNNVVTGKSIINGSIFSNGRLILVNPTGILMGPTSAVRAEGAILSTLNITNQNKPERVARFIIALFLIPAPFIYGQDMFSIIQLSVGCVLIFNALSGMCVIYRLVGANTCKI